MTNANRNKWPVRFWLGGTMFFSGAVLYELFRGAPSVYLIAALVLFAAMTMVTLKKNLASAESTDGEDNT